MSRPHGAGPEPGGLDSAVLGETRRSDPGGSRPLESWQDSNTFGKPLAPGTRVGDYAIEKELGSGAFGTVYSAVHPVIGKRVAIKVLSLACSADPAMVSRFVAEAQAVNKIGHSGIVDIFSFGQIEDGRHYLIMEFLQGETLEALLERKKKLTPADAIALLRPIARALQAAHEAGVAHRDLKPANIFVASSADGPRPKLLDFGIAKLMDEQTPRSHRTATGHTLGTPAYMAPEQCKGEGVDHRSDIYAFGIVAYELLTGRLPFEESTMFGFMNAHVVSTPPSPSLFAPEIPQPLSQAVLWLLEKDQRKRPQNMLAAMEALEAGARGQPTKRDAALVTTTEMRTSAADDAKDIGRGAASPWRPKLIVLAVLGLVLGAAAAAWMFFPKEEPVQVQAQAPEAPAPEPPKPAPVKVEPPPAPPPEPVKAAPPPAPEPVKVEPPKPEPAKVEPPKVEPAKKKPPAGKKQKPNDLDPWE